MKVPDLADLLIGWSIAFRKQHRLD